MGFDFNPKTKDGITNFFIFLYDILNGWTSTILF